MKKSEHKKKVYLAGPDVFEKDAIERGKQYVKAAKDRNLIGLFPLDNKVCSSHKEPDYEIFRLNKELLDTSDYVVANLSDFRGHEPDSGTVWEVAYAFAKGKIVIGYINDGDSMVDRIKKKEGVLKEEDKYLDRNGRHIENFGNPLNLMLQHSLHSIIHGTIEDALNEVKKMVAEEKSQKEQTTKKVIKKVA